MGVRSGATRYGLTRHHPRAYRRVCARQAEQAPKVAETCPPLIPSGHLSVLYAGPFGGREGDRGGYSSDLESASLQRIDGKPVEANGGHWRYDVAWTTHAKRLAITGVTRPADADEPSSCHVERVRGRHMRVCRVAPHDKGGGINGGHIAYIWRRAGVAYVISLHGYPNRPRARAMMASLADAVARG